MLSNSQKEHLTYTAVWQVVILVALVLVIFRYIVPGVQEIGAQADRAQVSIDSYGATVKDGISDANLQSLLQGKIEYGELVKVIQSDINAAKEAIKKDNMSIKEGGTNDYSCTGVEYITCLKNVLWRSDKEKENIKKEKAKLSSIIPTMSPFSNNIAEDNITLKQYVNYIEKTILKRFNFDSNVIIGMQGLTFGKKGGAVPESIGMFDFRLDFKASNDDIIKFIEYINESWKPTILSQTGLLASADIPAAMSNPLITMESFSVQEKLDPDNPTKENSGRATLRFYVRGVSQDDLIYLKENLKAKQAELEALITENVKNCEKNGVLCASYKGRLFAFQSKYQEYVRSLQTARISVTGSDEIYALTQSANTLKSLEEELSSILPQSKK
jgi:hypothetical protein